MPEHRLPVQVLLQPPASPTSIPRPPAPAVDAPHTKRSSPSLPIANTRVQRTVPVSDGQSARPGHSKADRKKRGGLLAVHGFHDAVSREWAKSSKTQVMKGYWTLGSDRRPVSRSLVQQDVGAVEARSTGVTACDSRPVVLVWRSQAPPTPPRYRYALRPSPSSARGLLPGLARWPRQLFLSTYLYL